VSQENVEIVRSIYDAWAREEFPGPPELMDAEIEYRCSRRRTRPRR
jgi:hypothetical protein